MIKAKKIMPKILVIGEGALTTYRLMAEEVVNKLGYKFGLKIQCSSHVTPLLK